MNRINSDNPGQDLDSQASEYLPQQPHHHQQHPQLHHLQTASHPHPQPQTRRPRGFAAAAAVGATSATATSNNSNSAGTTGGKGKKEREKEKERTKLRERHRRAITSRMLAGLRQYGNFPLPARADMNDVLAALAREAGWVVEADGTTYRQSPPPSQKATYGVKSGESPLSASSLRNSSVKATLDCQPTVLRIDESLSPASLDSVVIAERDTKSEKYTAGSPVTSVECLEADQLMQGIQSADHGSYFTNTPYIPVYIKLRAGIINKYCQLIDPDSIRQEISNMKSLNVDGIVVDCWWGIVEAWSPQKYVWSGYRELFYIIREFKLKLQVVMAFHEYGGNDPSETLITLPQWVLEIGQGNPDIFFTDREGQRNTEYLSWGIDKERVLKGRTGIEVYFDFIRSFRTEFDDLFAEGLISSVEIGLGASGELKYPSFSERMGWRYPGIGEFQCYDKYLQQSLCRAAKLRGHSFWARGPDNAGHYNSMPHETGFFCERGDYDSYYGRFFLNWYSQTLIDHADNVLSLASLSFEETNIIVKVPAVYLWYKTPSHAAELTAGFYNSTNQDGYAPLFEVLKKHSVTMKFMCLGLPIPDQGCNESMSDSEGLTWQVLNSAWDRALGVAGENALPCCDSDAYKRLIDMAKPRNDPDHRHFTFFVHQQPSLLQGDMSLTELGSLIKCMHGEMAGDMGP